MVYLKSILCSIVLVSTLTANATDLNNVEFLIPETTGRSHMVIAPHPDDELLIAAGILYRATQVGEKAQVAILTNGDAFGYKRGKIATKESVDALKLLNVQEDNIFIFGYGDQLLDPLYLNKNNPDQVLTSQAKLKATEAFYGYKKTDYHRAIHGVPAAYTRNNFLNDMIALLTREQPTDIYAVVPEDTHPDHRAGTLFLFEALEKIKITLPTYRPTLHLTIVHAPGEDLVWPGEINRPDLMFTEPAFVKNSPYKWADIESIPVPYPMAIKDPKRNLKVLAIDLHKSKTKHDKFLYRFVRANEFFWKF